MSLKTSWRPSAQAQELADLREEAASPQRRDDFARAASLPPPVSAAEGLRQLWDLLDLLDALSGPLPADRTIVSAHIDV